MVGLSNKNFVMKIYEDFSISSNDKSLLYFFVEKCLKLTDYPILNFNSESIQEDEIKDVAEKLKLSSENLHYGSIENFKASEIALIQGNSNQKDEIRKELHGPPNEEDQATHPRNRNAQKEIILI